MIKSGATTGKVAIVDTERIFTIWSPLAVFRANTFVGKTEISVLFFAIVNVLITSGTWMELWNSAKYWHACS